MSAAEPDVGSAVDAGSAYEHCSVYDARGRRPGAVPLSAAVAAAEATGGFVWVGLREPTAQQLSDVADVLKLPAFAVDDAVGAHQRPKLEGYDDILFAVLKPADYIDPAEVVELSEIAVFLGPTFVVTVRHGRSDVLARVRDDLDDGSPELLAMGAAAVLYRLADRIVDQYEAVADEITTDVDDIEEQVFGDDRLDHSRRIYYLKTELIEFRRAVTPLSLPLSKLAAGDLHGVPAALSSHFRDVHDHLLRATDAIEALDRMLTDVLSADLAQVSVRQNETAARLNDDVRKISAWAAIAAVPTAIAGIYGMNFENMPELQWQYGYFLVVGLILTGCAVLAYLFRRNGWL